MKHNKIKIFIITLFSCFILFTQYQVLAQVDVTSAQKTNAEVTHQSPIVTPKTADITNNTPKTVYNVQNSVKQNTSNELFVVMKKFVKVMIGVVISSIVIYLLLLFVGKFYAPTPTPKNIKALEDNLKSTSNENEALKVFFNKTKNRRV